MSVMSADPQGRYGGSSDENDGTGKQQVCAISPLR
jgi:hypothetical protein